MTRNKLTALLARIHAEESTVLAAGQSEYANSDNVLGNFERLASMLSISRESILLVYMMKHIDGIASYIHGHRSQREDVRGGIKDARAYLALLWGMVEEKELEQAWVLAERDKRQTEKLETEVAEYVDSFAKRPLHWLHLCGAYFDPSVIALPMNCQHCDACGAHYADSPPRSNNSVTTPEVKVGLCSAEEGCGKPKITKTAPGIKMDTRDYIYETQDMLSSDLPPGTVGVCYRTAGSDGRAMINLDGVGLVYLKVTGTVLENERVKVNDDGTVSAIRRLNVDNREDKDDEDAAHPATPWKHICPTLSAEIMVYTTLCPYCFKAS